VLRRPGHVRHRPALVGPDIVAVGDHVVAKVEIVSDLVVQTPDRRHRGRNSSASNARRCRRPEDHGELAL